MADDVAECFINGKADSAGFRGSKSEAARECINHLPDDGKVARATEELDVQVTGLLLGVSCGRDHACLLT